MAAACGSSQTPWAECRRENAWRRAGRNADHRLDTIEDLRCDKLEREGRADLPSPPAPAAPAPASSEGSAQ
jgi:hypothetical protein